MEERQDNKMGIMPVNKLLLGMALPMMASMMVQALYNVVDSIFVARITDAAGSGSAGTDALVAVGMAFPVQTLMIAFSTGMGVGMNALLSRSLGEKDYATVNKAAMNGLFLALCNFILFFCIGAFLSRTIIASQGGEGRVLEYGKAYLGIVCMGSIGSCMQITAERLLQSTGRSGLSMATQMTGALINIILDPILIFGYFGLPAMGVAGAAYATIAGQIVGACMGLILNIKYNKDIEFMIRGFKPDLGIIGKIYSVGLPTIVMQSIGSVMTYFMNRILAGLDAGAVAVFTLYFKLQSFFFMPIFGLNNGMIPIVAFNYGAHKRKRMVSTIKLSMVYAFILLFLGFLAFEIIPDKLLLLFDTKDDSLIRIGVPALRIIAVHYLLAWFCVIAGSVFQALGNGIYSLIVSVARQLVVLLPAAVILAKIGGLPLIWWCFPVAEVMSLAISALLLRRINREIISKV